MNTGIELVQSPIIKQNLAFMGSQVTERINALNISGQVATIDTVKALKELRAELNKELTDFEQQRKFVKEAVLKPYNEFEELYKNQISEKYTTAISTLKDKIATVEDAIKSNKKIAIMAYFHELCTSEKIGFLTFENVGLDINLSTTEKAYKEKVNEYVQRVVDDLSLIDTQEWKSEILVEYKSTLNASRAIKAIQDRKERERLEQERIRLAEIERRKQVLRIAGFKFVEFTNAYEYDMDIFMSTSEIETLGKIEFANTVDHLKVMIAKKERELSERIAASQPKAEEFVAPIAAPVYVPEPLQAPKVVEEIRPIDPPKMVSATFEVTGTREQLYAVRDFLINNKINYINV